MTTIAHRSPTRGVAAVLLLAAVLGGLLAAPLGAAAFGRISGTVTGPGGVPVAGVMVDAGQLDGVDWGYAETTSDGSYTIFGLDPGAYEVTFLPSEGIGLVGATYPTDVTVMSGVTTSGIDAELTEGGSISGTLTLPEDMIPIGVVARAIGAATGPWGFEAEIAFDGSYQIDGLPPGDYLVAFDSYLPSAAVPELYDDVRMPADATWVTVVGSDEVAGIDATIEYCTSPAEFHDVTSTNRFCGDIDWLIDASITTGYADGGFHPSAPVTRAAMAAFLHRLAGSPPQTPLAPGTCVFSDVCAGHPFEAAIVWIDGEGIAGGYQDGTYRPGATVSRQAMASFLYEMAGEPLGFLLPFPAELCDIFFSDVCDNRFLDAIMWLVLTGTAGGYADGGFHPTAPVSRQAMASFLTGFETNRQLEELVGSIFDLLGGGFGGSDWQRLVRASGSAHRLG